MGLVVIAGPENRRSPHQGRPFKETLSLFFLLPLGNGQRTQLLQGTESKDKGDRRAGPGTEQEVNTEDKDPGTGALRLLVTLSATKPLPTPCSGSHLSFGHQGIVFR